MRLKFVLLLCSVGTLAATPSFSQQKLDVDYNKTSLISVLNDLKARSGYRILYSEEAIPATAVITMAGRQVSIERILDEALLRNGLTYTIKDNVIVVGPQPPTSQQRQMRYLKGTVRDTEGLPLVGVTVHLKNTRIATATDVNGHYNLPIPAGTGQVIQFSMIGMEEQQFDYSGQAVIDVVLKPEVVQVDDVVVTGYATYRKSGFTGTHTMVTREELLNVSTTNILQALQVFDPSLRLVPNNEMGSDPNTVPEFTIRGESGIGVTDLDRNQSSGSSFNYSLKTNPNLPVFFLDGLETPVEKIYDMDPYRISTITILKDAAATAMYGSRASNGVIVIETMPPTPGKLQVSYNFTGSVTAPDLSSYNMMNAREKVELEYMAGTATGGANAYRYLELYLQQLNQLNRGVDTYWLSQPLRMEFNHQHNVYIEGGEEAVRFGLGINYSSSNGVMKGSFRNTLGAEFKIDYRMGKWGQLTNNVTFGRMNSQDSPYGSFGEYVKMQPYHSPYNLDTGELNATLRPVYNIADKNPLYEALLDSYSRSGYWGVNDDLNFRAFFGDFQFRMTFGIAYRKNDGERFTDPLSGTYSGTTDVRRKGEMSINEQESLDWSLTAFLNYNKSIGEHNINANLGVDASDKSMNGIGFSYRGFASAEFAKPEYAYEMAATPARVNTRSRLIGVIFTGNYTFRNTYLLDASFRTDGSSAFGRENRYAPFGSLGTGINLHNYQWVKNVAAINKLRVTASYGYTGRANFSAYDAETTFSMLLDKSYSTGFGAKITSMGNENLTWDKQKTLNIGFETTLWNRLSFDFSWYDKRTRNMVTSISLPSSSGFTSYVENMGEVLNRGFEINLNYALLRSRDWDITVGANAAHNSNKIVNISNSLKEYNERVNKYYAGYDDIWATDKSGFIKPVMKYEEGGSLTAIYGMRSLGVTPTDGYELYLKRDGTVTYDWSAAEQVIVGNTTPDLQGSFMLSVRWKAFSLFASFMYEFGGDLYNTTLIQRVEAVNLWSTNVDRRMREERWRKPGDVVRYANFREAKDVTRPTSRFVQRNNYVKFNSVTIAYEFDRRLVSRIGMKRLNLQFRMNDIATFSTIKQERGTSYPFARTFGFTLSTGF